MIRGRLRLTLLKIPLQPITLISLKEIKLNLDRVNAKVTAADNAAKNAITMRGQDITKELGLNSDLVEQIKAAQKHKTIPYRIDYPFKLCYKLGCETQGTR